MTHVAFLLLIVFTGGSFSEKVCSYHDVVDYLNLTTNSGVYKLTRPVLNYKHPTVVQLDIILYAILAVIEKTQTFIPFVWATMTWNNERIKWDPDQFCGINSISVPREMLWMPDLFIYEMIQKDDSPLNPYMYVLNDGTVTCEEDLRVVSTCRMDVHKFPFDTQKCTISIGSAIHCVDELRIFPFSNASRATQFSREVMKSQGEWEFLDLSISSNNFTFGIKQWEQLIYTFTMKRRPLLHVINFLLPILFFLSLDIASFFIADHRGEKLGFKVTVLLAISVLLLILNDILPSMSNKTPLIATYCIVIFAMMLLSLLETILVTYLMEKDSASYEKLRLKNNLEEQQEKVNNCNTEEKRENCCPCICKVSDSEKQHELLPVAEVVNNSIQWRESHVLLLILEELKELQHTLNLHLNCRHQPCCHQTSAHLSPPPRHSLPNCINESAAVSGDAPRCSHHSHKGNRFVDAMMLTGFIFLLFLTDGVLPENNCSYQDVLNHLQLTKTNELYSMTRPVKNYKRPTQVSLEVLLYAILDV
ncbi:5-hydroxytryptamine receptor 3C-like, partial [Notothenia coriiceps]|uniref:5-hydroxytryptamine receptor 3C-like n=1 Tax=Notothenia coriiceps TaxID=8208 RepID=A0A6I9P5M8_9TELE